MNLRFFLRSLIVSAGLLAGGPVLAASTQTNTPAPAAAPKVYAQAYGSWIYRCQDVMGQDQKLATKCLVLQNMGVKKDNHVFSLAVLMFTKANDGYDVSALVPMGILLPPGIELSVDQRSPLRRTIDFCSGNSCAVEPQPADDLPSAFKAGKTGHLIFTLRNGHPFNVSFSLDGFSDALNALNSGKLPPEVKG